MLETKQFWQVQNAFLIAWYMISAALIVMGRADHWAVIISAVILAAHLLEIPLAMHKLKDKNPAFGRLALGTLLFGYTWWVPAKKGIYQVS
ncbi:MAG: hypothetical protein R3352_07060 [Salinisphaeraceae bacterium]|nr:hypothetical protein [Salinisphaeraceae bacterium]